MTDSPNTNSRRSAIYHVMQAAHRNTETLRHCDDLVKLGLKGPGLDAWAQQHGFQLPSRLYDVAPVGEQGLLARVGAQEIILECPESDALLLAMEKALLVGDAGLYRIEQQSATFELAGEKAIPVLAQTCGVHFSHEPSGRIAYTRVAGVACGVIVLADNGQQTYRIWTDYTLSLYLWETFVEIIDGL